MSNNDAFIKAFSFAGFILLWHLASLIFNIDTLPSPATVLEHAWSMLLYDDMLFHLTLTILRVGISFILAMLAGIVIGVFMGKYSLINNMLDSLLMVLLNIPALVTIILCYIWMGLNDLAAIIAVVINKLPLVIVTIREGARSIDNKLLEMGQAFKISKIKILFKIYLPQLYPYIFAAARNGLSLIWKIVLVVELLGQSNGVGFKLGLYFQYFDIKSILGYTLAFALIILFIEAFVIQPLENRLNRWRT